MSEKLCLQWNDFKANTNSAFERLRDDKEFTDVTLACEDGQQIEAHKVILAASSPFFGEILQRNKHPHPLIYLHGFRPQDLLSVLDFLLVMYIKYDLLPSESKILHHYHIRLHTYQDWPSLLLDHKNKDCVYLFTVTCALCMTIFHETVKA